MNNQSDAAFQFAKNQLSKLLIWQCRSWYGPVAHVLSLELNLSIGPYQIDYDALEISEVIYGHNIAIPKSSTKTLFNAAACHLEAYRLALMISADLLRGSENLPSDVRVFSASVLQEVFPIPPKPRETGRDLPSTKNFVRDHAVWLTLRQLQERFNVPPTQNTERKSNSDALNNGPRIILTALHELQNAEPNSLIRVSVDPGSINAIWRKRAIFERLPELVHAELQKSKSMLR